MPTCSRGIRPKVAGIRHAAPLEPINRGAAEKRLFNIFIEKLLDSKPKHVAHLTQYIYPHALVAAFDNTDVRAVYPCFRRQYILSEFARFAQGAQASADELARFLMWAVFHGPQYSLKCSFTGLHIA